MSIIQQASNFILIKLFIFTKMAETMHYANHFFIYLNKNKKAA